MTAHWESILTQISEKQCRYQDFMQPLVGTLFQLIDQARSTPVRRFRGIAAPGEGKKSFSKGKGRAKAKDKKSAAGPAAETRSKKPREAGVFQLCTESACRGSFSEWA